MHCRIPYSVLTVVLFVKLGTEQNTHISVRKSRSIQNLTHCKRSCLHGCSEDEHKMAIVTFYSTPIRTVQFCHGVTGKAYHEWCANYRICVRLKKQDRCVLKKIIVKEKIKQINSCNGTNNCNFIGQCPKNTFAEEICKP
jgi:hypothetical protein